MQRILDITACLFSPPESHDSEASLLRNERIEFSSGDIEEHSKLANFMHKNPKQEIKSLTGIMNDNNADGLGEEVNEAKSIIMRKEAISRQRSIINNCKSNRP